jgi:hypothetical protein
MPSAGQYFQDKGYEGQIASTQWYQYIRGTLEEVTNGSDSYLPWGRFVVEKPGGGSREIALPSATGQRILGVTPFSDRFMRLSKEVTGYPPKQSAAYLAKGVIFLRAETAMTRNGDVYVRHTANTVPGQFEAIGRVRNDADSGKADLLASVRVLDTVVAGQIFSLELDLPITWND